MKTALDKALAQSRQMLESMMNDYNQSSIEIVQAIASPDEQKTPTEYLILFARQKAITDYFASIADFYSVEWTKYFKKLNGVPYTEIVVREWGELS